KLGDRRNRSPFWLSCQQKMITGINIGTHSSPLAYLKTNARSPLSENLLPAVPGSLGVGASSSGGTKAVDPAPSEGPSMPGSFLKKSRAIWAGSPRWFFLVANISGPPRCRIRMGYDAVAAANALI